MAFAFGQNMTELGRNIIDLEQIKNARDAQQLQAQNQFLAQLNQAALGRQQLAAQSQQSNNALMAQALHQQMQQRNQDRDFGLRQTSQTNQAQQFKDALDFDRKKLEAQPYNPSTVTAIARENFLRERQNKLAQGKAVEATQALANELKRYSDKKALTLTNAPRTYFGLGGPDPVVVKKLVDADTKEHSDNIATIMAGLSDYRDLVNVSGDPTNPSKIRFEPVLLPRIDFSGIGQQQTVPDIGTGENYTLPTSVLPIPSGASPRFSEEGNAVGNSPLPVAAPPQLVALTDDAPNFPAVPFYRQQPVLPSSGFMPSFQGASPLPITPRLPSPATLNPADWIPMVDSNGVVKRVHKSKIADWLQTKQWQALNAGTNSLPIPNY